MAPSRNYISNELCRAKTAFFALQCFQEQILKKWVQLLMDNTTAVACINHFSTSHSTACNDLMFTIWECCIAREIWLTAAHIPGKENTTADAESRKINLDAEWQLNMQMLQQVLLQLQVQPSVDLFASRFHRQMSRYVSYRPDPLTIAVDAFPMAWKETELYAFPPFSVIPWVLQKIWQERGSRLLVVPQWPSQMWWPVLLKVLTVPPVVLWAGSDKPLLMLPSQTGKVHPLQRQHLKLLV